jgi:hypothetical protein
MGNGKDGQPPSETGDVASDKEARITEEHVNFMQNKD